MKLAPMFLSLALLVSTSVQADVLVVDEAGGGDFFDLPEAVAAAVHGDTLLVRTGQYTAPALVDKGLRIVADSPGDVRVYGRIEVTGIPQSHPLLLSGLKLLGVVDTVYPLTTVHVLNSAGPVRFNECTVMGFHGPWMEDGGNAVLVNDSLDVAFVRCELRGGDGGEACNDWPTWAGSGLEVWNSDVSSFRSLLYGGDGGYGAFTECAGGYPGSGAVISTGSTVFSLYNYFEGGEGGGSDDFLYSCQWGGDGVFMQPNSDLHEQASVFVGGEGGFTPPNDKCPDGEGIRGTGTVHAIPGSPRGLVAPRVVRGGESYELQVFGLPGDRVFVFWSPSTDAVYQPARFGVWLLSGPGLAKHQALGTIDGSGSLTISMTQPDLGTGNSEHLLYAQVLVRDSSGVARLGSPAAILAVDSDL